MASNEAQMNWWGRTLSGKMSHLVTADSRNKVVRAACGLKISAWWVSPTAIGGRKCPKCEALEQGN